MPDKLGEKVIAGVVSVRIDSPYRSRTWNVSAPTLRSLTSVRFGVALTVCAGAAAHVVSMLKKSGLW